jgi:hypothetical protein
MLTVCYTQYMSGSESRRKYIKKYKEDHPYCEDCGGKFLVCQLDFHHEHGRGPEMPSHMLFGDLPNLTVLKEEIAKCAVLCKNCHALRHYKEREAD